MILGLQAQDMTKIKNSANGFPKTYCLLILGVTPLGP
ncbi:hypothetical protein SAMN05216436_1268 [bacterium A37T11]|nr:hypothetical protein SAMN05216436_1268 [bacterium A37T11]